MGKFPSIFKRIQKRELGPHLYDREHGTIIREKLPLSTWIENGIMYSKPLDMIDRTKYIRKLLKSETMSSEHRNNLYASSKKIPKFVDFYNIKMSDFLIENPNTFATFNEFFIREIKPETRPLASPDDSQVITCAADCRLSVFDTVKDAHRLFIKGKNFSLQELLSGGADAQAKDAIEATADWVTEDLPMANFRLSPMDYHRFHSPVSGVITDLYHIPGQYYTVEPIALSSDINVLGENARSILCIQTEEHGRVLFIPIGAEAVGKVNILVSEGDVLRKGDEIGYFDYGGSDIIVIFENPVDWDSDIYAHSHGTSRCIETLLHVNEKIATYKPASSKAFSGQETKTSGTSVLSSIHPSDAGISVEEQKQPSQENHAADVTDVE